MVLSGLGAYENPVDLFEQAYAKFKEAVTHLMGFKHQADIRITDLAKVRKLLAEGDAFANKAMTILRTNPPQLLPWQVARLNATVIASQAMANTADILTRKVQTSLNDAGFMGLNAWPTISTPFEKKTTELVAPHGVKVAGEKLREAEFSLAAKDYHSALLAAESADFWAASAFRDWQEAKHKVDPMLSRSVFNKIMTLFSRSRTLKRDTFHRMSPSDKSMVFALEAKEALKAGDFDTAKILFEKSLRVAPKGSVREKMSAEKLRAIELMISRRSESA